MLTLAYADLNQACTCQRLRGWAMLLQTQVRPEIRSRKSMASQALKHCAMACNTMRQDFKTVDSYYGSNLFLFVLMMIAR